MESSELDTATIAGGLFGLLVGDALGVPYEFHPADRIPSFEQIEMTPPSGFRRAHVGVAPGTWSDDGAHALILLDSLLVNHGLDLSHLGTNLCRWLHEGLFAVNRNVFDVGAQTSSAINALTRGVPAHSSGPAEASRNGNGSLMRVLPLVLWHRGSDLDLLSLAAKQSLVTHGHARARIACALYCAWARYVAHRLASPWNAAEQLLRTHAETLGFPTDEVDLVLDPSHRDHAQGTGYVVDCLWSARIAFEQSSDYASCVRRAIAFGNDTDTTAAVAGGLAGLRDGIDGIPVRWIDALRGREMVSPLLARLTELLATPDLPNCK